MENVIPKFVEKITRELSGNPDARRETLKSFEGLKETEEFLKRI